MKRYAFNQMLLFSLFIGSVCPAQTWQNLGSGTSYGVVLDMKVIQNELWIAGGFDSAGGVKVNHLAKWNGITWSGANSSFNNAVYTIGQYNNKIYAGGGFYNYRYVADWNGTAWDTIGIGVISNVYTSAVYKGELYIGGSFWRLGDGTTQVNRIARWDGVSWKDVGGGVEGAITNVQAMTIYNGELIVGGNFNYAGGQTDYFYIAAWDGTNWKKLATGPDGQVTGLTVDTVKNVLYATGLFDWADTVYSPRVAKWDGTRWHAMRGGEIVGGGFALCMYHGELYMGGQGGGPSNIVLMRWDADSSKWEPVPGPNTSVRAMTVYKDTLFVGGSFTMVNGDSRMSRIAKYWAPKKPISVQEVKNKESEIKVFPNPFSNSVVFKLLKARPKAVLALFDRSGKRQEINYSLENENTQILLQRGKLAKGIYFYRISDPQTLLGEGKLLIE